MSLNDVKLSRLMKVTNANISFLKSLVQDGSVAALTPAEQM